MNPRMHKVINAVLFQVAWFAAVLGTARGMPWLGPVTMAPVLAVHLALAENRRGELKLLLAAGLVGFIFDTALVSAGIFTPLHHVFPPPFSPPWMICLWVNFAATLTVSMAWLQQRYALASLFGSIGGPLAYYSGAQLGATEAMPTASGLALLALGWGMMTPLLVWLARLFSNKQPTLSFKQDKQKSP